MLKTVEDNPKLQTQSCIRAFDWHQDL